MTEQTGTQSQTVTFVHPSEAEFAHLLDFYGVAWEYEPRTFALEWDEAGNVSEAFTPDFYLPQQDLFIELTTMRTRLITRKNRKIRRLRELYPDINIRLVKRSDFKQLFFKYQMDDRADELLGPPDKTAVNGDA